MSATEESELPLLRNELEIDDAQEGTLDLFQREPLSNNLVDSYDAERRQLVNEGASWGATLDSRIKMVKFGRYRTSNAALVILQVDFKPKKYNGSLRFRDAQIEVQIYPGLDSGTRQGSDGSDGKEPQITRWFPELVEGDSQSDSETWGFSFDASVPVGGGSVGPSVSYSVSRERPKRRVIHGSLVGKTGRLVNWKLEENSSAGDGIPPICDFGLLVRWPQSESFHLRMKIRATTFAGLRVRGKDIQGISFSPRDVSQSPASPQQADVRFTRAIKGGVVVMDSTTFAGRDMQGRNAQSGSNPSLDTSADVDLTSARLDSFIDSSSQIRAR